MMPGILLSGLFGTLFLFAAMAVAQEGARHAVSAQGTGFFYQGLGRKRNVPTLHRHRWLLSQLSLPY